MYQRASAGGGGSDWYNVILLTTASGAAITITDGDEEVEAVGTGSEQAIAVHNQSATYEISVVANGLTGTCSDVVTGTTTGAIFTREVDFAHVELEFDEDFQGLTGSLTDGTTTVSYTFPATGTTDDLYIPTPGTWKVTCTVGSDPFESNDVVITSPIDPTATYSAQIFVIPNGETALPINSIPMWLLCGNVKDKSYTTLNEVLADETTLRTLLTDDNAIKYLKRSKEWIDNPLVPVLSADDGNVIVVGGYYGTGMEPWKAFNGSNTYGSYEDGWIEQASAGTPCSIGYHFSNPVAVNKVYFENRNYGGSSDQNGRIKKFKIQASNDGFVSDIHDLTDEITRDDSKNAQAASETVIFENNIAYSYYRLYITQAFTNLAGCGLLQFYYGIADSELAMSYIGAYDYAADTLLSDSDWKSGICNSDYMESVSNTKVPTMTDNTHPSGEAFGTNRYSAATDYYLAFDGTDTYCNLTAVNSLCGYDFESAIAAFCCKFKSYSNSSWNGQTFKIVGSNDKTNWTDLSGELSIDAISTWYTYTLNNGGVDYRYIALQALGGLYSGQFIIAEMQFYGRENAGVQTWLKLAGLSKPYTTLDEVLADPEALASLMASHDAVDYLVTVKSWISAITSNEMAMMFIGANNYAADTLLADSNFGLVPVMTDNTHPSGEAFGENYYSGYQNSLYNVFDGDDTSFALMQNVVDASIGYDFIDPICIKSIRIKYEGLSFVVEGSDTGSSGSWTTLFTKTTVGSGVVTENYSFENSQSYRYYRIRQTAKLGSAASMAWYTIQFYGKSLDEPQWLDGICSSAYRESVFNDKVPAMTSNTDPEGVASANQEYSQAFNAFSADAAHGWYTYTSPYLVANDWVAYEFTQSKEILAASFKAPGAGTLYGKFQAYDGTNWIDISEIGMVSNNSEICLGVNTRGNTYSKYRWLCTTTASSNRTTGLKAQFYGREDVTEGIHVFSAADDTVYEGVNNVLAVTDETGHAIIDPADLPVGSYTIKSTVAKDPNNLSNAFTKDVEVTAATKCIMLMPDNALYWYGYKDSNLENATSANGWGIQVYTNWGDPTYNTNNISMAAQGNDGRYMAVGAKDSIIASKVKALANFSAYVSSGLLNANETKSMNATNDGIKTGTLNTLMLYSKDISSNNNVYPFFGKVAGSACSLSALWTEKPNPLSNFFSAANDTVYYMQSGVQIPVCKTDDWGGAVVDFSKIPANTVLYSSVAKDPDNLSNAYSKAFNPVNGKFYLMPENVLYWYGYSVVEFDQGNYSYSGATTNAHYYQALTMTKNVNDITLSGNGSAKFSGVYTKDKVKSGTHSTLNVVSHGYSPNASNNRFGTFVFITQLPASSGGGIDSYRDGLSDNFGDSSYTSKVKKTVDLQSTTDDYLYFNFVYDTACSISFDALWLS